MSPQEYLEEEVITKKKLKKPSLYEVLLHNDDYTSMEFVVYILQTIFHKTVEDATAVMLSVHKSGIGIAGIYTCEIAESKANQVRELARLHEFPLECSVQPINNQ